jgi:hypothetical protein
MIELIPPELNVQDLPPEHVDDEHEEDPHQGLPILENPGPRMEDPGEDMVEDDDVWEGMEVNVESVTTEVIGPNVDLDEDDDMGTDDATSDWEMSGIQVS